MKIFSAGTVAAMGSRMTIKSERTPEVVYEDFDEVPPRIPDNAISYMQTSAPDRQAFIDAFKRDEPAETSRVDLENYIAKMQAFDQDHSEDIHVSTEKYQTLLSTFKRIERVQNLIGYGNFNVVSFDEMLRFSRRYNSIGAFPADELEFFEDIFFSNAQKYGFFGEKVTEKLTMIIPPKESYKVPYTGHYVYRGESLRQYQKIRQDIGDKVILTSGIRGIVKQTHLFLAKTIQAAGNLSRASRSLAPPGHSFHGIGDFDVGRQGYGQKNFTTAFARTNEFKRLVDLGYINIRYPENNLLGVRFEPWHIKVV